MLIKCLDLNLLELRRANARRSGRGREGLITRITVCCLISNDLRSLNSALAGIERFGCLDFLQELFYINKGPMQ